MAFQYGDAKELKFINLNLFSGSTEAFRSAAGRSWTYLSSSEGESYEFQIGWQDKNELFSNASGFAGNITAMIGDRNLHETITGSNTLVPSYRLPIRVWGNRELVGNDTVWKSIMIGGTQGTASHDAVWDDSVYVDSYFHYRYPYTTYEQKVMEEKGSSLDAITIDISYNYNFYISEYEDYYSETTPYELNMPNLYFVSMLQGMTDTELFPNIITNSLSRDGAYEEEVGPITSLLDETVLHDGILPPEEELYDAAENIDRNLIFRNYLSSSIIKYPLSGSTERVIRNQSKAIVFNAAATENYLWSDSSPIIQKDLFPYCVKIEFTPGADEDYFGIRNQIIEQDYDTQFLQCLKLAFDPGSSQDSFNNLMYSSSYGTSMSYYTASVDSDATSQINSVSVGACRTVNFMEMMVRRGYLSNLEASVNYQPLGLQVGEHDYDMLAMLSPMRIYRFTNTQKAAGIIDYVAKVATNWYPFNSDINTLDDFYKLAAEPKRNETLAFRIEKSNTLSGEVLQNFWIMNNFMYVGDETPFADSVSHENSRTCAFYDTQVKYGVEYTYKIYAYVFVYGVNYKFSDLRITRTISEPDESRDSYCLEFYDPFSDQPRTQLVTKSQVGVSAPDNELLDNTVILTTNNKYCADFYLNYEPNFLIKELELTSKSLTVLDHPGTNLHVKPFQMMDNSQKVGFFIQYEDFAARTMPLPVTDVDINYREAYLNSNNMLRDEKAGTPSRARQQAIESYRMSSKPERYTDFNGFLHASYDLSIDGSKYNFSNKHCYDTINTNTKYYYLFKGVTEHGIQSHISPVYEIELIDDGGYKYLLVNTYREEDLVEESHTQPTKSFKKLLLLEPNVSQLSINMDEDVDFEQTAGSQISKINIGQSNLEDSIWNKTFKVRLTSKKTGKKIDFNITYNVDSELP